jgi:hypothetical protein
MVVISINTVGDYAVRYSLAVLLLVSANHWGTPERKGNIDCLQRSNTKQRVVAAQPEPRVVVVHK